MSAPKTNTGATGKTTPAQVPSAWTKPIVIAPTSASAPAPAAGSGKAGATPSAPSQAAGSGVSPAPPSGSATDQGRPRADSQLSQLSADSSAGNLGKEAKTPKNMILPKGFHESGSLTFCCVDSEHSGDMYHIRAARAIKDCPVLVYNTKAPESSGGGDASAASAASSATPVSTPASGARSRLNELEQYLSGSSSFAFGRTSRTASEIMPNTQANVVPADPRFCEIFSAGSLTKVGPKDFKPHVVELGDLFDESGSTEFIVNEVRSAIARDKKESEDKQKKRGDENLKVIFDKMNLGMSTIHVDAKEAIETWLDGLLKDWFQIKGKEVRNVGLVLFRDSGTTGFGPYPENDTGTDAAIQLQNIINGAKWADGTNGRAMLCGNEWGKISNESIFKYFDNFKLSGNGELANNAAMKEIVQKYGISKRDLDVRFWQMARDKGYVRMVVGLRSGALDLFTFLGIPTVSIQLRRLKGASRMNKLSPYIPDDAVLLQDSTTLNAFKRMNINYYFPRHGATRYMVSTKKGVLEGQQFYNSPFWGSGFKTEVKTFDAKQGDADILKAVISGTVAPAQQGMLTAAPGGFNNQDRKYGRTDLALVTGEIQKFMQSTMFPK